MAHAGDLIVNSVLCFVSSAKTDHTNDSLIEIANAFFSHEEIKGAKVELTTLLKKDVVWRRDPDKKRKDFRDVIDFYDELIASKAKVKFVTDSYKRMPPIGMELIAPILVSLTEEVAKINDMLPKILDIKTEVLNSADTIRQLKIDVNEIKSNFSKAISGLKEASDDISDNDLNIIENIRSFRQSFGIINSISERDKDSSPPHPLQYASAVSLSPRSPAENIQVQQPEHQSSKTRYSSTGAISKRRNSPSTLNVAQENSSNNQPLQNHQKTDEGVVGVSWSVAGEKQKMQRQQRRLRRENNGRVTGSRKEVQQLRAVKRTADVFIGRMDNHVTVDIIKDYISDNFEVKLWNIEELEIKTDKYKAFKVTVSLNERDKLFNSELWPEDIIVDKFYNRKPRD